MPVIFRSIKSPSVGCRDKYAENAIMVVLPADQYIVEEGKYLSSLSKAIDFVKKNMDKLVVLGLKPTFPSTEFGYIKTMDHGLSTMDHAW